MSRTVRNFHPSLHDASKVGRDGKYAKPLVMSEAIYALECWRPESKRRCKRVAVKRRRKRSKKLIYELYDEYLNLWQLPTDSFYSLR